MDNPKLDIGQRVYMNAPWSGQIGLPGTVINIKYCSTNCDFDYFVKFDSGYEGWLPREWLTI